MNTQTARRCQTGRPDPIPICAKIQLLVEGKDDVHFFETMLAHISRNDVQVRSFDGVDQLPRFLEAFMIMPGYNTLTSIAIVRDADHSAQNALKSVQNTLRKLELPFPEQSGAKSEGEPCVAVLIMAGDDGTGMLETLLCKTFENQPIHQCIESFLNCSDSLDDIKIKNRAKARAHAFLATRAEPHLSVGYASRKKYWNLEHEALKPILDFLKSL